MDKKYYILLINFILIIAACDVINPEEELPSFVRVEPFDFKVNLDEGSASTKIDDAWLYVDGELLGAFTLPATVPVLKTGEQEVLIDPGIKENGVGATPTIYPYYTRYTTTVNLTETEITTVQPESQYADNLTFVFIENFSTSNLFGDDIDGNAGTAIVNSNLEAFEGNSGRIELDTDNPRIEVATSFEYTNIPVNGTPVYLEMDYKNNINMFIGVRGINDNGLERAFPSHGLNPSGDWNKVYINLTEVLTNSQLQTVQVFFSATLPDNVDNGVILLDNVKLLHFE